jgi:hypothetical protein
VRGRGAALTRGRLDADAPGPAGTRPAADNGPMPSVFLSIPSGHNVSNLLRSEFLPALVDSGAHIVVLSPFAADPAFVSEFTRDGVEVTALPPWNPGAAERAVESALSERFLRDTNLQAVRLQRDRARLLDPWNGRRALAAAKSVLVRLPVSRPTLYALAQRLSRSPGLDALIARHRPAFVVTASAGFLTAEVPLIYAAKRAGVPQMGIDLGWDNLASKYHTIMPVDTLAVWNDDMRDHAIRYHGFSPARVAVVGAVQFDQYFAGTPLPARQAFLRDLQLDTERPLITVATAPYAVYPSTAWLIDIIATAMEQNAFGRPAQLLVRVHPRDDLALYERFAKRPHVTIEKPVTHLRATPGTPQFDQFSATLSERQHLAATLAHSDVLVNFASTTTIEACLFDTPVINVGFDEHAGLPPALSIRRYFHFEHYQPVVETGAATIASTPEALIEAIGRYLADRSVNRAARQALTTRLTPYRDGGAGRRLARVVVDALPTARKASAPA